MSKLKFLTKYLPASVKKSLAQAVAAFTQGLDLNEAGKNNSFTEPYRQSTWVRSAISKVAGPISAVEIEFVEHDQEVEDPALDNFWSAPALNPNGTRMSAAEFADVSASWLLLRGEVFYLLDDSWNVPFPEVGGMITPIIILRPDRVQEVVRSGELVGWIYTDPSGKRIQFDPTQLIQVKLFNPYNPWRGLGPLQAAMIAAEGDYAAGVFAKNTAEANGDQGVYIIAKGGMPDDKQREQIVNQLREKRSMQTRGIFRPAFLTGDITIEDPKLRTVDVAFISQRIEARKEIAIAFGVPPSFFDPVASYSIGSQSDRYILIEETCKPLGVKLCGAWSQIASRVAGRPVQAKLDWDDHSVMQAVRRERLESAIKLWSTGMPMEKVSDYLSLDLPEYPGWNVGYLPFAVAPVGEPMPAPTEDPALAEPVEPADAIAAAFRRRSPVTNHQLQVTGCACGCSLDEAAMQKAGRDPKEIALWKSIVAKRRETMKAFRSKFNKVLMVARAEVLQKLERGELVKAVNPTIKATAADFVFDLLNFTKLFTVEMRNVAANAVQDAGEQVYAELKRDDPWKAPAAETMHFLAQRKNRLSNVPQEAFNRIRDAISEGLERGDTLKEIAAAVRGEFNDISDGRGAVIAGTETSAAYGFGRHWAMKDAGIQYKRWLVSGNSNVRAAHLAMNGVTIPINEWFVVLNPDTGETDEVLHPGDESGAAWNVINCHCVSLAAENPNGEPSNE
jgi:phage portal protein BeeE